MGRTLRKRGAILLAVLLAASISGVCAAAKAPLEHIEEAARMVREMAAQTDAGAMSDLLDRARGIAAFPAVVKAGLIIGGRHGDGLVVRRNPETGAWYGPAFIEMTGASFGLQIGVQSTALLLVIANERGMKAFEGGRFTLGGDVSVAVGPVGRHAEAGTDSAMEASIYSYSITKGIFAGISLEGAVIDADEPANAEYWGVVLTPEQILSSHRAGAGVKPFIREIEALIALGR